MPSFGSFLKKKRTKEGHPDKDGHSHSSASNPTSPVAPTAPASKLFDSSTLQQPRAPGGSHSNHTGAGSGSTGIGAGAGTTTGLGLGLGLGLAAPPGTAVSPGSISPSASTPIPASAPASSIPASAPASAQAPAPAASSAERDTAKAAPPVSPTSTSTSTMNPVNVQSYAPPGHDSQNLPSISNLINSPQNDGSTNGYAPSPSPYQTSAPVMADSNAQQQQHLPSEMQLDPPQQQQQQAVPQHQPQQQTQQQQHPQQPHHGHSISLSQPRVTKGKYSLGDFEILRTLGTGSFGRVHLVQSKHNQRFYAVKVLKKAQVVKMKQVEHTNDERRMLSDVKHPFLITLWGTFQDWKNLYMVMDFVEGGELFSLLRKSGV